MMQNIAKKCKIISANIVKYRQISQEEKGKKIKIKKTHKSKSLIYEVLFLSG